MHSSPYARRPQVAWSLAEIVPSQLMAPLAGVDEAGRGPLAGPVCAAAVILPENYADCSAFAGLNDSKKCSASARHRLEEAILSGALSVSVAWASVAEIDELNILQASLLAMQRAVAGLTLALGSVLVDGNQPPRLAYPTTAVVKGDALVPAISAASILAKQARDRAMTHLAERYPEYGFDQHKGYPTRAHLEALERVGVSEVHRRSFAPVRRILDRLEMGGRACSATGACSAAGACSGQDAGTGACAAEYASGGDPALITAVSGVQTRVVF